MTSDTTTEIPIRAAEQVAKKYGYDQIVIIGRAVGRCEHVTTYGRDQTNCAVAARIGDFLKHQVMQWPSSAEGKVVVRKDDLGVALKVVGWFEAQERLREEDRLAASRLHAALKEGE